MSGMAGYGRVSIEGKTSASAGNNLLFGDVIPASFAMTIDTSDPIVARGLSGAQLVTIGSFPGSSTQTFTVGIEGMTLMGWILATNQMSATALNRSVKVGIKTATVPATSPYEIVDALITTTDLPVSLADSSATGFAKPLTRVSGTPAAANEYQVVTGSTKIVLHSSLAGKDIIYSPRKEIASIETIGVTGSPIAISELSFSGLVTTDLESSPAAQMILTIPKATYNKFNGITISGDGVITVEIEYTAISTITGQPLGFQLDFPLVAP